MLKRKSEFDNDILFKRQKIQEDINKLKSRKRKMKPLESKRVGLRPTKYICSIHDNDKCICNIYDCSGEKDYF